MATNEDALMWVEKYRPKSLDEVVGLKDIVESLKAFMRNPKLCRILCLQEFLVQVRRQSL
jgi:hypothetical protein